ncbi:MAG: response regulator, partial [Ideonella sp.]|nr:response regulator [Ideonella sp.]
AMRCARSTEGHFDLVILDIMMPQMDGLEVLQQVKERHPEVDGTMVTGPSQIQTAVKGYAGASDHLPKPFDPRRAQAHVVDRALERRRLLRETSR